MSDFGPLVNTPWLVERLGRDGLKIIDGSWRMPGDDPARSDYDRRHIDGAVFFDIDQISDQGSDLPHMAPTPALFAKAVGALGISSQDNVIVYDDKGCFSAARIWWTFRLMGHEKIAVLDGGLVKWLTEGHPVTNCVSDIFTVDYQPSPDINHVCNAQETRAQLQKNDALILDARPSPRFLGVEPEPRKGLRSGAMPGAVNLPFAELFKEDKTFLDPPSLAQRLSQTGVAPDKDIITTCGSGITAAVLSLALEISGHPSHKLYDGSWTEWGSIDNDEKEFPIVVDSKQ